MFPCSIQAWSGRPYCGRGLLCIIIKIKALPYQNISLQISYVSKNIAEYGEFLTTSPFENELLSKALTLYITALLVKLNNQKSENAIRWSQYFWLLVMRIFSKHCVLRRCSWYCKFKRSNENTCEANQWRYILMCRISHASVCSWEWWSFWTTFIIRNKQCR